jgi:asparagine synthase (glutamine-hydrolysing)
MKNKTIHFFGTFSADMANDQQFESLKNTEHRNLIACREEFTHESSDKFCLAFGRFYDLNKSCKDIGIAETDNPAEAIALSLERGNIKTLKNFYGEFTFIFNDFKKNLFIIGRDFVGAGMPVFYNDHYFSSDINAFKFIKGFDFVPDELNMMSFLHVGTTFYPQVLIKGVRQLMPGQVIIKDSNGLHTEYIFEYDDYLRLSGSNKMSEIEAAAELERLHKLAIGRRIKNRNKIALLLSGGYDSGGNVATLSELYDGQVNGYTIGFKNDKWSELPLTKIMAAKFNINLHDYLIDGSEINELPVLLRNLSNPFNENGLMVNYTVMKMASQGDNNMILGGDGNDQVYGTGIQQIALHHYTSSFFINPFLKLFTNIANSSFPNNQRFARYSFHAGRIVDAAKLTTFGFTRQEIDKLFKNSLASNLETDVLKLNKVKANGFEEFFRTHTFFKDFRHDACSLIVFKASAMSRLFGQNLSFPYMDKDMIQFVWSLPINLRTSGTLKEIAKGHGTGKYLHKKYLKPKLPNEITQRKKQGGFAPLPSFFNDHNRRQMIYQIIQDAEIIQNYMKPEKVKEFFDQYELIANQENAWFWYRQIMAFKLFNLLVLSVWWEIHGKENQGEKLSDFIK